MRAFLLGCALVACAAYPAEAMHIVSPAAGATVHPGDLVTVQIALDPGESASEVGVFNDGEAQAATASGATFARDIKIPTESVGPDLIVAYAVLNGGGALLADVQINVDAGPLRTLLIAVPPRFVAVGQVTPIEVRGVFEDGIVRDLSSPDVGTTFATSNETVLAVHPAGIAQSRDNGEATLTASVMGRSVTTKVTVNVPTSDNNHVPSITPGPDQTATAEQVVTLSATASDPDGDTLEYVWDQVAGRLVVLHDPTSAAPQFVAPRTVVPQVLEFLVSARDARGATTLPVRVRVTVNPAMP
jgi:hypothetical protein